MEVSVTSVEKRGALPIGTAEQQETQDVTKKRCKVPWRLTTTSCALLLWQFPRKLTGGDCSRDALAQRVVLLRVHCDYVQRVRLQVLDGYLCLLGSDPQLLRRGGVLCGYEEAIPGDLGLWGGPHHQNGVLCNFWEAHFCGSVRS